MGRSPGTRQEQCEASGLSPYSAMSWASREGLGYYIVSQVTGSGQGQGTRPWILDLLEEAMGCREQGLEVRSPLSLRTHGGSFLQGLASCQDRR